MDIDHVGPSKLKSSRVLLSNDNNSTAINYHEASFKAIPVTGYDHLVIKHHHPHQEKSIVYGVDNFNHKHPIRVNQEGKVIPTPDFNNITYTVYAYDHWVHLPTVDISHQSEITFAVINRGDHDALAQIQISPNKKDNFIDIDSQLVPRCDMNVLVQKRYLQYVRLSIKTVEPNDIIPIEVYIQMKS